MLGADGEAVLDGQGQRVHPQASDWDVNNLVQFLLLLGAIDGSSRTLSQRLLVNLLMQSRRVLFPMVGAAVDTDGWYNKEVSGSVCLSSVVVVLCAGCKRRECASASRNQRLGPHYSSWRLRLPCHLCRRMPSRLGRASCAATMER